MVDRGVPFDVAFVLEGPLLLAMIIAFGELDGGEFDWAGMRWRKKE